MRQASSVGPAFLCNYMADISKFRAEIDAIDEKLVRLLNERSAIVKNVGAAKKKSQKSNICYIRAGREAEKVRSIYDLFKDGLFPANAAAHIWRMIICASLSLESRLAISVSSGDDNVYWLAREYFGPFIPVRKRNTSEEVIADIEKGVADVGVLPVSDHRWWLELPDDIKIFGCVPFLLQNDIKEIKALAFARLLPEETGNDITLLKLTVDIKLTQKIIEETFGKLKMNATLLGSIGNAYLIEIPQYLSENNHLTAKIEEETGFAITVLGSYAVPLEI